jgi:hypothetical protein
VGNSERFQALTEINSCEYLGNSMVGASNLRILSLAAKGPNDILSRVAEVQTVFERALKTR